MVLELEQELQTRARRSNRARVLELLAPDFTEIVPSVNSYLADIGLPAAPGTWWEVALPDGM